MDVRPIVDCKTSLGEGPVWDVQDQKIYWIDSLGNKVFRANQDGPGFKSGMFPERLDRLPSGTTVAPSSRCRTGFMLSISKLANARCC
jgi:sugar lactone lactonase YvrE